MATVAYAPNSAAIRMRASALFDVMMKSLLRPGLMDPIGISLFGPQAAVDRTCATFASSRRLPERLREICDQIGTLVRVRQTGVGHAIAGYHLLGVRDERIERLRVPHDIAALERR